MATTKDKYYTKMLETLVDYNDRNNAPLSKEKILQAVSRVMAETEGEECDSERNANNVTMDIFFNRYPIMTNTQGEIANVTNERQISLNILAETIKGFNGLTIQSTINDSLYYDSDEDDAESDQKSDSLVATHTSDRNERKINDTDTTNRNSPQKLLKNREIPSIIQGVIPRVNQITADGVTTSRGAFRAERTVLHKEIVPSVTRSTASVLKNPSVINCKNASRSIPVDRNTVGITPINTI